jgi:uncharacterized protein YndB with AHSA1/START domain
LAKGLVAELEILINVSPDRVWEALTTPSLIKQYAFGSDVRSEWKVGSTITWAGEWQGRAYEDKGRVLEVQPGRRLVVTHWSPMAGVADSPDNYHTLVYELAAEGAATRLRFQQDNNATEDELAHSAENWRMVFKTLKELLEGGAEKRG